VYGREGAGGAGLFFFGAKFARGGELGGGEVVDARAEQVAGEEMDGGCG